ncbi:hypothetical protein [Acidovorax sp. FJL06]|uniref:hypothetical protein n=1 Tax=Acidovorax sp. FJL06 TaxID=2153365 RepID=UPI000F5760D7|nr:hypothetical protein [Acidovorax sp. FJL06]
MALNTDFGLSVPYRFRFAKHNNGSMTKKALPEPESRNDALAWHFRRIAGERSIEVLRMHMKEAGYDIGAGTLWRMSRGEEGVRATSIKKLAAFDGREPDELLRMPERELTLEEVQDSLQWRPSVIAPAFAQALEVVMDAMAKSTAKAELKQLLPMLVDTNAAAYRARLAELLQPGSAPIPGPESKDFLPPVPPPIFDKSNQPS